MSVLQVVLGVITITIGCYIYAGRQTNPRLLGVLLIALGVVVATAK